jgi:parallel beta-helix repeat protein
MKSLFTLTYCIFILLLMFKASDADIITVPTDYLEIQEAVNNASEGDTVYILNGTYSETIELISDITILGQDKNTTVIDGGGSANCFYRDQFAIIRNVRIENIKIINFNRALHFSDNAYNPDQSAIGVIFKDNIIENASEGLFLYWNAEKTGAIVENNIIQNCHIGIYTGRADTNVIIKNNFITKCYQGMEIQTYSKPLITNNIITHCSWIGIEASGGNSIIVNNTVVYNEGLGIRITHNSLKV